jgi:hypothetical protein
MTEVTYHSINFNDKVRIGQKTLNGEGFLKLCKITVRCLENTVRYDA